MMGSRSRTAKGSRTRWMGVAVVTFSWVIRRSNAQGLPFYWYFDTQDDFTIPSCSSLDMGFSLNPNSTTPAAPPYYLIVYPVGQVPQIFPAGTGGPFTWQVGYPQGTQLFLSFVDSKGNTGGVGPLYTIIGGANNANCAALIDTTSPISFTTNPSSQPLTCQNVVVTPNGGTPPYTLTLVVNADTARNSTFSSASHISFNNTLTGGGSFIAALSDSTGQYALSTALQYSGGGGDTSCFTNGATPSSPDDDKPKSGGAKHNDTSAGEGEKTSGNGHRLGTGPMAGIAIAVVALLAAGAFLLYRRWKGRQGARSNGGGGGMNGNDGGPGRDGREKYGSKGAGMIGGGMWRPESPTEYPGIAPVPVRFRVTNPDDDARSEFSLRTGQASRGAGGATAGDSRLSVDTVRSRTPSEDASSPSHEYGSSRAAANRGQRQSLIDGDANALYPPTSQYATLRSTPYSSKTPSPTSAFSPITPSTASSQRPFGGPPSIDEPWPTYSSAASTSTEDHYMDHPASSAGALGGKKHLRPGRQSQSGSSETDMEEVYSEAETETEDGSYSLHRPSISRTASAGSNAYGSPFADSQRIR